MHFSSIHDVGDGTTFDAESAAINGLDIVHRHKAHSAALPPPSSVSSESEPDEFISAEIPPLWFEMERTLQSVDCLRRHDGSGSISEEMVILWRECIERKIARWRNNGDLVAHCFALHSLYYEKGGELTMEYISLFTAILSNSTGNKSKMDIFLDHLHHRKAIHMMSFRVLVGSCYNEYTGYVLSLSFSHSLSL